MRLYPATIKGRVIASVVLIHAVLMLLIVGDITYREYRFMKTQALNQCGAVAAALATGAPQWLLSRDLVALEELIAGVSELPGFYMAFVLDATGRVVAANDRAYFNQVLTDPESRMLLEPLLAGNGRSAHSLHHDLIDVIHPVRSGGRVVGFVRLISGFSQVREQLTAVIVKGVFYAILAILLGALTAWMIMNALAKRMEALTRSASHIAGGKLDEPLPAITGNDELDMLTKALATMQKAVGRKLDDMHAKTVRVEQINEMLAERVEAEVSKRRRQEQMLIQQSKLAAMGEMINAIAHHWRQPLNALVLIVQDLEDAYRHGELDKSYFHTSVEKTLTIARKMSAVIDDFGSFLKPAVEKTLFDPAAAVEEVLRLTAAQMQNHHITVRFDKPALSCRVEGYPNEFKHAVMNILNNARQAIRGIKPAGTVTIMAQVQGREFCLRLCDEGPGIPEALRQKIFEPYFTTWLDEGGTGVGLYMAKTIIEDNMNGRLEIEPVTAGACFSVYLPCVSPEDKAPLHPPQKNQD